MAEMQKLLLRCRFALGDVVLLTAAVRDLHQCFPGRFLTDVRTGFADLWAHNPYLSPLHEYDAEVGVIDCDMPLVERSDQAGKHALHGFLDFLGQQLAVKLHLTDFRGDIHLSADERDGASPIPQLTNLDVPYWLISAGGKQDCTVKWWDAARYQAVVDHFRGQIQFVQIGRVEHWHPELRGVIDLRGRTEVRDLVRLVYHADGVLCGVTALMHLAAAVPLKAERNGQQRPCVVVAGGREPPHWEAYPGHQFIHTVGALRCCAGSGCWKSRTKPLGDGEDTAERLCVDPRGELPRCMEMISADEVIRRIELYVAGGGAPLLSPPEAERAAEMVAWSERQPALSVPVNFYNAPQAAADFIARIPPCQAGFAGRGIVICGGGARLFSNAWVCIQMLRRLGCKLPVQLWHFGKAEMDSTMEEMVKPLGVTCIDATAHEAVWPARINGGWGLKPYAIINSPFEEVLLLDADNVPVLNPEFLFDTAPFKEHGAIFWPDQGRLAAHATAWKVFDVSYRDEPEVESGQVLVNKSKCWAPLLLCLWYNEHASLFYKHVYGDKETFHFAFRRLGVSFAMTPHPLIVADGALYHHDFDGRRLFQHRNMDKWNLLGRNRHIADFWFEGECLQFLGELAQRWDGQLTWLKETQAKAAAAVATSKRKLLRLALVMAPSAGRKTLRADTLERLAAIGWPADQVLFAVDERRLATRVDRLTRIAWRALQNALATDADYVLYLEDDLAFNRHLLQNLNRWGPLARRELHIGSLCNFGFRELVWDVPGCAYLVDPLRVCGCKAVLLSRQMVEYCLDHWFEGTQDLDLKLGRLAAQAKQPFFFHCPSLVQPIRRSGTADNGFRRAEDFDPVWKSSVKRAFELVRASAPAAARSTFVANV
jgi:ADP-heptose:LPS heptosyltransferase